MGNLSPMTIKVLGIDPGLTTGLALIEIKEKRPKLIEALISKDTSCFEWKWMLEDADVIVCEDFKVRPNKARKGAFDYSSMDTSQIIGSIKTLAKLLDKEIVLQPAAIKPVGFGFAHLEYTPGKKGIHIQDAAAHAMYYAVRHNLCLPSKLL